MNKHTILLIDDETNILTSLKRVLEADDRQIFTAETAEAAWELLKEKKEIEVIICDNRMPGMAGIDFLAKVKRRYPDTIRILATGYPDLSTAMDAINKAHIWRYILKPVDVDELEILLKQAFDYYRIVKENRMLLQIVRQHSEWIKTLKKKYPQAKKEIDESDGYTMDETRVAQIVEQFMKKYYTDEKKP